jgi:hypothetical protein
VIDRLGGDVDYTQHKAPPIEKDLAQWGEQRGASAYFCLSSRTWPAVKEERWPGRLEDSTWDFALALYRSRYYGEYDCEFYTCYEEITGRVGYKIWLIAFIRSSPLCPPLIVHFWFSQSHPQTFLILSLSIGNFLSWHAWPLRCGPQFSPSRL